MGQEENNGSEIAGEEKEGGVGDMEKSKKVGGESMGKEVGKSRQKIGYSG